MTQSIVTDLFGMLVETTCRDKTLKSFNIRVRVKVRLVSSLPSHSPVGHGLPHWNQASLVGGVHGTHLKVGVGRLFDRLVYGSTKMRRAL